MVNAESVGYSVFRQQAFVFKDMGEDLGTTVSRESEINGFKLIYDGPPQLHPIQFPVFSIWGISKCRIHQIFG
jgi:hypothetical protein